MIGLRRPARHVRAGILGLAAVAALVAGCSGSSSGAASPSRTAGSTTTTAPAKGSATPSATPSPTSTWTPGSTSPPIGRFACPAATVNVTTADQLTTALAQAKPGDVIHLADGTYVGGFTATTSGNGATPIWLCGSRDAVLQGRAIDNGYVLHLDHASHWRVAGFTVRLAQKGVVVDSGTDDGLQDLVVEHTGDEGVHLRRNSSGNVVRGVVVSGTGLVNPKSGEGIYIGSAKGSWFTMTEGQPDRSDNNYLIDNTVSFSTAESIDVKEGTSGGFIMNNRFDGSGMTVATSWVNVKGNSWTVSGNHGVHTPKDGFQVQLVLDGWGQGNAFSANTADLTTAPVAGVGIAVGQALTTRVACNNVTVGPHPASDVVCTGPLPSSSLTASPSPAAPAPSPTAGSPSAS